MLKITAKRRSESGANSTQRQGAYIREYEISNPGRSNLLSPATPMTDQSSSPNFDYAQPVTSKPNELQYHQYK